MPARYRLALAAATLICAGAAPAAADAATLTLSGSTLTYVGAPGGTSNVSFNPSGTPGEVDVTRGAFGFGADDDAITSNCTQNSGTSFTCAGVAAIVVDTGDGNDSVDASGEAGTIQLSGGAGDDFLNIFAAGPGADTISGGDGDDQLSISYSSAPGGADVLSGGAGIDFVSYSVFLSQVDGFTGPVDVAVSTDGVANDGVAGQGANLDGEDSSAFSGFSPNVGPDTYGKVTLIGNAAGNSIFGDTGNDTIDGGAGSDSLSGSAGDDTINARDGYADRVNCGSGTADVAVVDTRDQVGTDCESIQSADVGNALDDRPPTIAWTAPAAAAKLPGDTPTTLTVNAADDKGVTQVQFLDDDRVVCTDTTAPYTCAYQARGDDVGRNTLVAIASDAVGNTASSVRTVTVDRFKVTTVSLTLKPTKDTSAPWKFTASGKLTLPSTVSAAACKDAVVAVIAKAGKRTISTRTDSLDSKCAYKVTVTFTNKQRFPSNGKLKFQASFRGNIALQAKKSSTKTASTK